MITAPATSQRVARDPRAVSEISATQVIAAATVETNIKGSKVADR
jgi:hypothetical protein